MKNSATFLSLGLKDLAKGAIMAILTVIVTGLYTALNAVPPSIPDLPTLENLGAAGLVAGAIYLMKNFLTNSNDQFLKKEPKVGE